MKNTKLRIAWLIPNILLYVTALGFGYFVLANAADLQEINRFGIWITMILLLAMIAIWGSMRLYRWIKQGKM